MNYFVKEYEEPSTHLLVRGTEYPDDTVIPAHARRLYEQTKDDLSEQKS
jgi:hypothetical protein